MMIAVGIAFRGVTDTHLARLRHGRLCRRTDVGCAIIMWVVGIGVTFLLMAMLLNLEILPVRPAY